MSRLAIILVVTLFCFLTAQAPSPRTLAAIDALASNHRHDLTAAADGSFYCPMDPDIRATRAGKCSRCGMQLIEGAPDILECPVDLKINPAVPRVSEATRLIFGLTNPRTRLPVRNFQIVHEKLYHVFVVSQDLSFFAHVHPEREGDEDFHLDVHFPKPGMYRVLSDFYPTGVSPQLITSTVIVPGDTVSTAPKLAVDTTPKQTENANVTLSIAPSRVIARESTSLIFRIGPAQGLEQYLGAWGHMLAASEDLIDMAHHHPVAADVDGKELRFDVTFPRAGMYRVWVQFQRLGVVNTVAFNIAVAEGNFAPALSARN
jgi:hypothetical protein